jgi:hypothetical protein
MRSLEEQQRAAERPLVRKEAPNTGVIYKTRELVETVPAAADTSQEWTRAYVAQELADLAAELLEAVGDILGREFKTVCAETNAAFADLRRDFTKEIAALKGEQQARFGVLEPRIARIETDVRERAYALETKVDRALTQFYDATHALNHAVADEAQLLVAAQQELYGRRR